MRLLLVLGLALGCVRWDDQGPIQAFPSEEEREATAVCLVEACGALQIAAEGSKCLVADAGCDVWWRPVYDDVIPPMPELAVALPGTGFFAACRTRAGALGVVAMKGEAFGRCVAATEDLDGGGFDILQARRLEKSSSCEGNDDDKDALLERLRARLDALSSEDRLLVESVSGGAPFGSLRDAILAIDDACALAAVLSASRFVPHPLNAMGLHVLRVVLAARAREKRLAEFSSNDDDDDSSVVAMDEWLRDGIIVRDFDEIGGDRGLYNLLRLVSAEPTVPLPPYEWVDRNVTTLGSDDPQHEPHVDSFASVLKVWLFRHPLDATHGPLTFVKGSHALSEPRLRWMHAYSQDAAALREPSFRLRGAASAEARAPDFVRHCLAHATPVLPLPNATTTLVVADTSAVHFRAKGVPGVVRQSSRLKGDNAGGLPRLDPFRWPEDHHHHHHLR